MYWKRFSQRGKDREKDAVTILTIIKEKVLRDLKKLLKLTLKQYPVDVSIWVSNVLLLI